MGRPKAKEPRSRQFNLSLTSRELANLYRRAEAVGMRPSSFGRSLLFDETRQLPMAVSQDSNNERLIYGQLVRLGNNLNQLVRHLHRNGGPVPADLEPLLADIRKAISGGKAP